jgi:hypothetical protein
MYKTIEPSFLLFIHHIFIQITEGDGFIQKSTFSVVILELQLSYVRLYVFHAHGDIHHFVSNHIDLLHHKSI